MNRTPEGNGYFKVRIGSRQVREHVAIAESVLGKPLPPRALVHHADGNKSNNFKDNLVICPDDAYHLMLHRRMRAYDESGNPNNLKCWVCKKYDSPENIIINGNNTHHRACINTWQNAARLKRKGKL